MIIKKDYKTVRKGDKVGVFIPSSPVKNDCRENGRKKIEELGLAVEESKNILSKRGYIAKEKNEVLNDIRLFLTDKDIRILWAGRGGYGANYLIPDLREMLKNIKIPNEKIVIGASDVSYILWEFVKLSEITVLYGPMPYASIAKNEFNKNQLKEVLFGSGDEIEIKGEILINGKAEGILTGGCLTNFVSLLSTPFSPEVKNKILLLEDLNERPYRLDRMFWQIDKASIFKNIRGLILGEFPGCFNDEKEEKEFKTFLKNLLTPYNIPVIINLPVGHSEKTITVPLGAKIII